MKLKNTFVLAAAQFILISSAANANIVIKPVSATTQDFCSTVVGTWSGKGSVSSGSLKCAYNGTAIVTATADPSQFQMDISMKKVSGACPASEQFVLPATCKNGVVTIDNEDANLTGILSNNGNTADFTGTVNIPVGGSVIPANVDSMHLDKQK